MKAHMTGEAKILDISESVAQIALQGPRSHDILCKIAGKEDIPEKYYYGKFHADIQGTDCLISRTGYTGEDVYKRQVQEAAEILTQYFEMESEEVGK